MSKGIAVNIEAYNRFESFLNKEGVYDWTIWNAEDFVNGTADVVEVEFEDDEDFWKAFEAFKKATLH